MSYSRTFRYFASSSPGRFTTTLDDSLPGGFATWTVHHLDDSLCGHFTPFDVSIPVPGMFCYLPGHFATCLKVCSGGKTTKEVAKRPGIETSIQQCEMSKWRNV